MLKKGPIILCAFKRGTDTENVNWIRLFVKLAKIDNNILDYFTSMHHYEQRPYISKAQNCPSSQSHNPLVPSLLRDISHLYIDVLANKLTPYLDHHVLQKYVNNINNIL